MADVKWIKIAVDIFNDEKILLIEQMPDGYAIITVWFKLLCLAGKQNNSGVFMINDKIPYTEEMFASIFRMQLNTVRLALTTFENFGMVEIINKTLTIPKWGKHQSLDKIEKYKEYMRGYMREYRQKQIAITSGESNLVNINSKINCNINVNSTEQELKQEQEQELNKETKTKAKRAGIHPMFDAFWQAYPKRIAKAKAEEAFSKLNPDEELMKVMLAALKAWSETDQWTKESGQFVPNPTTWINQRRWEDELPQQDKPKERKIEVISD